MPSLMSYLLKLEHQICCLFGSCYFTKVSPRWSRCAKASAIATLDNDWESTFQILSFEKYRAYVILLNQNLDLVRHRSSIKAHHKQLA